MTHVSPGALARYSHYCVISRFNDQVIQKSRNRTVTKSPPKWKQLTILFIGLILFSACALAQSSSDEVVDTTLCDIVKAPQQFKGERVRIRAWLWSDPHKSWITEAGSPEIGKVCGWVPVEFEHGTNLAGSTAFVTFIGRLISVPTRNKFGALSCGRFIVEKESDIYGQEMHELIMRPFVYDQTSHAFVDPGPCLAM